MSDPEKRLRQLESHRSAHGSGQPSSPIVVPSVTEFVTGSDYLNRRLYPRQATLLKVLCLEIENLTDFDLAVITEWESDFTHVAGNDGYFYEGRCGTPPGTVQRMLACRASGRHWFREIVLVMGRRAGKGHLSALMTAYALWRLLALGNPQEFFGIEQTKQLLVVTMAADKYQASANVHRDVVEIVTTSPCFQPYLGRKGTGLRLRTPADLAAGPDTEGSILIEARPTTSSSGRGSAGIVFLFDEMAFAPADGQVRGADSVYAGTTPSLAQFPQHSLTLLVSSPASQTGEFYSAHVRALQANPDGSAVDPATFTLQLPSWALYLGWEQPIDGLAMWPGGPDFPILTGPILAQDSPVVRAARDSNRDSYLVEFEAQWRSSLSSYLDRELVNAVFGSYQGAPLQMQYVAQPGRRYFMWCDPSSVGANFGVAVGHLEGDTPNRHVVFDILRVFEPKDYPGGMIDYPQVHEHLWELIRIFEPTRVTFDQYNSVMLIQLLNERVRAAGLQRRITAQMVPATATRNWVSAEHFKALLGERRVHAPIHQLARDELLFLELRNGKVDHPTHGPVQTADLADCMIGVVSQSMDGGAEVINRLENAIITGTLGRGFRPDGLDNFRASRNVDPKIASPARGIRRDGRR